MAQRDGTLSFRVQEYPIFEKGIIEKNPALFEPYLRTTPDHQMNRYEETRKSLPEYEEKYKWSLVEGPGFCGATHPGTGKVFHEIMMGAVHPLYNSDCLYVNPSKNVFAISDPPGATTFSRGLITNLDELLRKESVENLESLINAVNRNTATDLRVRATLALLHIPLGNPKAFFVLSGDSFLFHGNTVKQSLSRLQAVPNRLGTPSAYFELEQVELSDGDFFVLASDGITAVRPANGDARLDETILGLVNTDPGNFALHVAKKCNEIIEEEDAGRVRTIFGCDDDVSVLLVVPQNLAPSDSKETFICGGYVEWTTP